MPWDVRTSGDRTRRYQPVSEPWRGEHRTENSGQLETLNFKLRLPLYFPCASTTRKPRVFHRVSGGTGLRAEESSSSWE